MLPTDHVLQGSLFVGAVVDMVPGETSRHVRN